jgi:hypothetical protein
MISFEKPNNKSKQEKIKKIVALPLAGLAALNASCASTLGEIGSDPVQSLGKKAEEAQAHLRPEPQPPMVAPEGKVELQGTDDHWGSRAGGTRRDYRNSAGQSFSNDIGCDSVYLGQGSDITVIRTRNNEGGRYTDTTVIGGGRFQAEEGSSVTEVRSYVNNNSYDPNRNTGYSAEPRYNPNEYRPDDYRGRRGRRDRRD